MKKYFIIVLLSCCAFYYAECAEVIGVDTMQLIRYANIQVVASQGLNFSDADLIAEMILSLPISYKILKSEGFRNIIFFSIESTPRFDTIFGALNPKFENQIVINPYMQKYTFAYNVLSRDLYRISGFKCNDFNEFYKTFNDVKSTELSSKSFKNKHRITKNFFIENVDLGCLYKKSKKLNIRQYPCGEMERRIF